MAISANHYPPLSQSVLQANHPPIHPSRASRFIQKVSNLGGIIRLRRPSQPVVSPPLNYRHESASSDVSNRNSKDDRDIHYPYSAQIRPSNVTPDSGIKPYTSQPMLISRLGTIDIYDRDGEAGDQYSRGDSPVSRSDSMEERANREENVRQQSGRDDLAGAVDRLPVAGAPHESSTPSMLKWRGTDVSNAAPNNQQLLANNDRRARNGVPDPPVLHRRSDTSSTNASHEPLDWSTHVNARLVSTTVNPAVNPQAPIPNRRVTPSIVVSDPSHSYTLQTASHLEETTNVSLTPHQLYPNSAPKRPKPMLDTVTRIFRKKDIDPPTPHPDATDGPARPLTPAPPLPALPGPSDSDGSSAEPIQVQTHTYHASAAVTSNSTPTLPSPDTASPLSPPPLPRLNTEPPRLSLPPLSYRFSLNLSDGTARLSPSVILRRPALPIELPSLPALNSSASQSTSDAGKPQNSEGTSTPQARDHRQRMGNGMSGLPELPLTGPSSHALPTPSPPPTPDAQGGDEDDDASNSLYLGINYPSLNHRDGEHRPRPSVSSSVLSVGERSLTVPSEDGEDGGTENTHSRSSSYNLNFSDGYQFPRHLNDHGSPGSAPSTGSINGSFEVPILGLHPSPTTALPGAHPNAYVSTPSPSPTTSTSISPAPSGAFAPPKKYRPLPVTPPPLDLSFLNRPPKPTRPLPQPILLAPVTVLRGNGAFISVHRPTTPSNIGPVSEAEEDEARNQTESDTDEESDDAGEGDEEDVGEDMEGSRTPTSHYQQEGYFFPSHPHRQSGQQVHDGFNSTSGKGKERATDPVETPRATISIKATASLGPPPSVGMPINFGSGVRTSLITLPSPGGKNMVPRPSTGSSSFSRNTLQPATPGADGGNQPKRPSLYMSKRASRSLVDIYASAKREEVEAIVDEAVAAEEEERRRWRRTSKLNFGNGEHVPLGVDESSEVWQGIIRAVKQRESVKSILKTPIVVKDSDADSGADKEKDDEKEINSPLEPSTPTAATINPKRVSKAPPYESIIPLSTHHPPPVPALGAIHPLRRRRSMPTFTESSDPPPYPDFPLHDKSQILPRDDEGRERLPPYTNHLYRRAIIPRKMEFISAGAQAKDRKWRRVLCVLDGTALKVYKVSAGSAGGSMLGEWWESKVGVGDVSTSSASGSNYAAGGTSAQRERDIQEPIPKLGAGEDDYTELLVRAPPTPITPTTPARAHPQLSGEHPYIPGQPEPIRTPHPTPQTRPRAHSKFGLGLLRPGKSHGRSTSEATAQAVGSPERLPGPSSSSPSIPSSSPENTSLLSRSETSDSDVTRTTSKEEEPEPKSSDLIRMYTMQNAESGLGNDYIKRKNVIRVRVEGEQFLLQAKDEHDVVGWIEVLQASTNIALDLDERLMPKPPIMPRRRRRRPRRPGTGTNGSQSTASATATGPAVGSDVPMADQTNIYFFH